MAKRILYKYKIMLHDQHQPEYVYAHNYEYKFFTYQPNRVEFKQWDGYGFVNKATFITDDVIYIIAEEK